MKEKNRKLENDYPGTYKTAKWAAGVTSSILFVADVFTDGQVAAELHSKGHYWWFRASVGIFGLQYGAAVLGVWVYLFRAGVVTPGKVVVAVPGVAVLDVFMVLYSLVPWWAKGIKENVPADLQLFLPSYHASRMVSEACFESVLQTLLQGYIFFKDRGDGSLGLDAATVGRSAGISMFSLLKNLVEIWLAASLLGHGIVRHLVELASMGAGLPLDAIMRGDLTEFQPPEVELSAAQLKVLVAACNAEGSRVTALTLSGTSRVHITRAG